MEDHPTSVPESSAIPQIMVFCTVCGTQIAASVLACPQCGAPNCRTTVEQVSDKRKIPAALWCFFLGIFGAHQFYVGKTGTGIIFLVLLILWVLSSILSFIHPILSILVFTALPLAILIWVLVDFVMILGGYFCDRAGLPLKR